MSTFTFASLVLVMTGLFLLASPITSSAAHDLVLGDDEVLVRVMLDSSYDVASIKISYLVDKAVDPEWHAEISSLVLRVLTAEDRQDLHQPIQEALMRSMNTRSDDGVETIPSQTFLTATNLVMYQKYDAEKFRVDIVFKLERAIASTSLGPHYFDLNPLAFNADFNITTVGNRTINPAEMLLLDTTSLQGLPPSEVTNLWFRPAYVFTASRDVTEATFGNGTENIRAVVILPQDTVYHYMGGTRIMMYTIEDLGLLLILPISSVLLVASILLSRRKGGMQKDETEGSDINSD